MYDDILVEEIDIETFVSDYDDDNSIDDYNNEIVLCDDDFDWD